jgi:NAD(P)H-hydrate epimerase
MIPVLSREEMRAFDAHAIEARKVPGVVLMENAGRGATDVLEREMLGGRAGATRVVVVCGTGNNGGDGFVVARHLLVRGARVHAVLAGAASGVKGDARVNLDAFVALGGSLREVGEADVAQVSADLLGADAIVDALFGTGLERPIDGWRADVVLAMNAAKAPRFAVDLPSGLDATTGGTLGTAVVAAHTATFAHYKLGLLTPNGADHAGQVHVVDIGVPASLWKKSGASAQMLERADVARAVTPRDRGAHKNSAGHVVAFAGSPGKTGAALMVAHAALRAGAGVATIATWPESLPSVEMRVTEVMTARLDRGGLAASVEAALAGKRAAALGPGFGLDDDARAAAEHVLGAATVPVVVDADALTHFAGRPEALGAARAAILTPHPGEAARLLGTSPADVERDRFGAARALAAKSRAVVVLKGACSLIVSPDGRVVVNSSGNAALATAGAGDVLCGILAAVACAAPPFEAACAAVYLHGLAGDAWRDAHGDRGLLASEIADMLPPLVTALAREHARWSV